MEELFVGGLAIGVILFYCLIYFLILLIPAVITYFCYKIAKDKNRNEFIAIILGIYFGIFALIYYLCVKEKDDE